MRLVLERTQKVRTSNIRTLANPNFEHLELISKNTGRTRTSIVELRTSKKCKKSWFWDNSNFFFNYWPIQRLYSLIFYSQSRNWSKKILKMNCHLISYDFIRFFWLKMSLKRAPISSKSSPNFKIELRTSRTLFPSPEVELNELEHLKSRTFRTRTQVRSITSLILARSIKQANCDIMFRLYL